MRPYSSYILCGTPRSGSTLLCQMLAASGIAGRPNSYYREQDIAYWADSWGVPYPLGLEDAGFDQRYLAAMLQNARGRTDTFGLRLMWESVAVAQCHLARAFGAHADALTLFEQAFGPTLYIYLSRTDKVAQAVSLARAEQSGLWHLAADGSVLEGAAVLRSTSFDRARIATLVTELRCHDEAWHGLFREHHIEPLRLTYESVTADPRGALANILAALGHDPMLANSIEVPTAKMADAISQDWIERFRRETGDRT